MHTDLINMAALHLRSGDLESARLLLDEALKLNPGDEQAWLWMSGAVETDSERLACLQQVLAIDPHNQAAQDGIQALLKATPQRKLDPQDASLESFLEEQEALFSSTARPAGKEIAKPAVTAGKKTEPRPIQRRTDQPGAVNPSPDSINQLRSVAQARGMDWGRPGLSLALPLTRQRAFGLPGLLQARSSPKKRPIKKPKQALIPWKEIPLTSNQVAYFVLGLIIFFLLMLIGFSVLKTLVQGPRQKAVLPVVPAPLPSSTPQPTPTPLVFKPAFVPSDCRFRVPSDAHVECLTMILPESREGDSARSIRLPLVIYRSLNPFPPPDPIVYLHGGGSAIEWAADNFENFILPLLYQRDVIVMEPRGNGQSTPNLDCPELNNQFLVDLKNDPNDNARTGGFVSAVQACRDRLSSQGIRFSNYTIASFAADIADMATVLGYEQINLYGVSYGGSVAQVVMREYPSLVRSSVLDSALPLEVKAYNSIASGADYALGQLFEACAASSPCRSAYPNLEAVFYDVKTKLDEAPITVPSTSPGSATGIKMIIDGTRFQQAVLQALYSNILIPEIPKGIYAARFGDTAFLEAALAYRMGFLDPSLGGRLSQNCPEQVYATSPSELEADLESFPNTSAFARYSNLGSVETLFGICELWKAAPFQPENKSPLASSIPTLVFTGQFDPLSPDYLGEQLAGSLERATLVVFPGLGHASGTAPNVECPLSLAAVFLYDPYSSLDPTCGLEMGVHFTAR